MTSVETVRLVKRYETTKAVDDVSMTARDGEFITILGPSGCGKSTTLRLIAGLLTPDSGHVIFDGKDVTDLPPDKRNVGFVFQRVALFPHMNVSKNIAFGLRARRFSASETKRRIREVLQLIRMEGFEGRMPSQLSGGQAQRVEIARVLAPEPDVLLFDEPLSNIDAKLRDELKYEIRRIQKETGKTMIYVTHDQAEAFAISDRIYVMNNGRIEQEGLPIDLYTNPKTTFVASFIGSTNFVQAKITQVDAEAGLVYAEAGSLRIKVRCPNPPAATKDVVVSVRPEDIDIIEEKDYSRYLNVAEGRVADAIFVGTTVRLNVELDGILLKVDSHGAERFNLLNSKGKSVSLGFNNCTILNF